MDLTALALVQVVTLLGTLSSLAFYCLCGLGISNFLRTRRSANDAKTRALGPVSILKPLKGMDPEMWESFSSHCEQKYPEFQLIFGVSDAQDPAAELVRRLQRTYPNRQIDFVVCDRKLGANVKVSNLAQMLPVARHELLIVNDSDIRVPEDYLQRVVEPLADDEVGLVTCLYRGVARKTLASRLEALGICADFVPGVLSARYLEKGLHFGLGSTLAFRRTDLDKIGGFEAMVDYLADDYELGRRIAGTGKKVELSEAVVETLLPPYSLTEFFAHQMRWSRTIRDARRGGYIGLLMTYGFAWAMAMLLAFRGTPWAWALFGVTLVARLAVAGATAALVLRDEKVLGDFFLLPIRDMMAPAFWTGSLTGNRISWRGDDFELKDGRLTRVAREASTK